MNSGVQVVRPMFYDPFKSRAQAANKRTREIREKIQKRLGRFGDEVVEFVTELALTPRKLQNILERLNLSPHTELDAQLDTLAYYVAQSGASEFVSRVRAEMAAASQETTRMDRPGRDPDPPGSAGSALSSGKYLRSVSVEKALGNLAPISAPLPDPSVPGEPGPTTESPRERTEADSTGVSSSMESEPIIELPWIECPAYTGPERRTGPKDRRTHADRRATLGAVMVNRRFGGERRHKPRGRRAGDHGGAA